MHKFPDLNDVDFESLSLAVRKTISFWRNKWRSSKSRTWDHNYGRVVLETIGRELNIDMQGHNTRIFSLVMATDESQFSDERDKFLHKIVKILKETKVLYHNE